MIVTLCKWTLRVVTLLQREIIKVLEGLELNRALTYGFTKRSTSSVTALVRDLAMVALWMGAAGGGINGFLETC